MTQHAKVAVRGLQVTQAADVTESNINLQADAVIVGSGAGGGIAAYELARSGKKVCQFQSNSAP